MAGSVEVFLVALRLGLTSFGGPSAHIGYFRNEYVQRRRWLTDHGFAELVAVAQVLPGPSSSQLSAAIGHARAGWRGALAAWLGFTAPLAVLLAAFAAVSSRFDVGDAVWLHALKLAAVAVVLDAVLSMATTLTRTAFTIGLAVTVAVLILVLPPAGLIHLAVLLAAALLALAARPTVNVPGERDTHQVAVPRRTGTFLLAAFLVIFVVALLARPWTAGHPLADLAAGMYRSGAMVFGGGHVVLPLLQSETVPEFVTPNEFLAGYGAAQAVPGPLFTFAAFLGQAGAGIPGAIVATLAIFMPGMLLMFGVLPYWNIVRDRPHVRGALIGVNAAALFLLLRVAHLRPMTVVALALAGSPLLIFA